MTLVACLLFLLGSPSSQGLDDAVEAKLGELRPYRAKTRVSVFVPPSVNRVVSSYFENGRDWFALENGIRENNPIKWVGWKMPEAQSVLMAKRSSRDPRRRLLIAGKEDRSLGEVHDAMLLDEGTRLALVLKVDGKMLLKMGEETAGPHDAIEILRTLRSRPILKIRDGAKSSILFQGKSYPIEGTPVRFHTLDAGGAIAWEEFMEEGKIVPVINGIRGAPTQRIHGGIHFSPDGSHVAYVTRDDGRYRAWIDGKQVEFENSIVAARVFSDGTPVLVEMWRDKPPADAPKGSPGPMRGRLVVDGKPEERVLERPVFSLSFLGEKLYGASRMNELSVFIWVKPDGSVAYEEVKGRIDFSVLAAPDGKSRIFTVQPPIREVKPREGVINPGEENIGRDRPGVYVDMNGRRHGLYDHVSRPFFLEFSNQFGFVAAVDGKTQLVVGDKSYPLNLMDFYEPVLISKTELTVVVVGHVHKGIRKEIWARVIQLD